MADLQQSIDALAKTLDASLPMLQMVSDAIERLIGTLQTTFQTIELMLVPQLEKLGQGLVPKKEKKEEKSAGPMAVFGQVVGQLQRVIAVTQQWVAALNPALIEQYNRAFADLQATAGTAFTSIFTEGIGFFKRIAGLVMPIFTALKPIVDQVVGTVFKALAGQIQSVLPIFEALIPVVRLAATAFTLVTSITRLLFTVVALLIQPFAMLVGNLGLVLNAILAPFTTILTPVLNGFGAIAQSVGIVMAALFDVLDMIFRVMLTWNLADTVKKIEDAFKELIKGIIVTTVKIAYLIDQKLGDDLRAAIVKRLKPGPGATAAGGTAIKNLETIGKDFALAAVNAAPAGESSTEAWQKEVADYLGIIADNTKDVRTQAKERVAERLDDLTPSWARSGGRLLGAGLGMLKGTLPGSP